MAKHRMITAQSTERESAMLITSKAVDQPTNTRSSFPWSNAAGT